MALIVGNLLTDPNAQSFESLEDADAYLAPELHCGWSKLGTPQREAQLVRASRWLAGAYRWNCLNDEGLRRVGQVTARLAAETIDRDFFAGSVAAEALASESVTVGRISESKTYRNGVTADAAGLMLPWLLPALSGLVRAGNVKFLMRA